MVRASVLAALVVFSNLCFVTTAAAQTKIEPRVALELETRGLVKVVIVTRADPDQPGGGASFNAPAGYVGNKLAGRAERIAGIGRLPVVTAEIRPEALAILREDPNIELVTRDVPVPPLLIDSVGLIGADKVHAKGIRGSDWNVAVLDTGIQADHPAFDGAVVAEACFSTPSSQLYDLQSLCPQRLDVSTVRGSSGHCPAEVDGCSHGTHVAGIVAGRQMMVDGRTFDAVAPRAGVISVQVFTLFQDPELCAGAAQCVMSFTSDQLRALDWIYRNRDTMKVAAVNMSLGGGYHDKPCDETSPLTTIIERLRAAGIATVIAAGNSRFFDGVAEPACISSAVTVAAIDKTGALDIRYSNVSRQVDFAAPGTAIVSSVLGSGYEALTGTSMAAPHVAGAFALMREQYPSESVLELEQRLFTDAPSVIDPRTETKLVQLEVSHAAIPDRPVAVAEAEAKNEESAAVPPVTPAPTVTGSFIVQTRKEESELQSIVREKCPEFDSEVKRIAEDTYKLEMTPRDLNPTSKAGAWISKEEIEDRLQDRGEDIKVFDDRAFAPLKPAMPQ